MIVPEVLVWSEDRVLFMSNHAQRRHAVRNIESCVESTVEGLRRYAPHIVVLDRVYLHGSKGLESTWLELDQLILVLCGTLWVD